MSNEREHAQIVGSVIVVVSLISFVQTSVILSVICSNKDMFRSSYHVLIGNLMIADLIVSIMGLFFRGPGLIVESYAKGSFLSSLCDIVPFITWSALYCASLAVLCITYNRMLALTNPLQYKVNVTITDSMKLVAVTWLSVILYFVISFVTFHTGFQHVTFMDRCFFDSGSHGKIFIIACDTVFFLFPLIGILYMYYRIVRVIRRERVANKNGAHIDRIREAVFKNISFLLFFFTLSWFPNYVIEVMVLFSPGARRNFTVEDIAVIMFYSNLVLDPLVYGLGSRDFRDKIGRVFHKLGLRLKLWRCSEKVAVRKMRKIRAQV